MAAFGPAKLYIQRDVHLFDTRDELAFRRIGSTSRRSSAMGWYENAFIKRMRRQAERKRPINKLLAALTRRNSDMWSMMFIGMGLFKLGVFSAVRSYRFYVWIAVIGLLIGMPL
jgi:hypothetical protein